jgi:hypothetical protein
MEEDFGFSILDFGLKGQPPLGFLLNKEGKDEVRDGSQSKIQNLKSKIIQAVPTW